MINCKEFFNLLKNENIDFFTGIPDSLLKDFCAYVTDNVSGQKNVIAANEGNAVALAAGYHLATNKIGLVYMQNSGLGNIVNPIVSLTDSLIYSIPMLLLVGWRGEPGIKDELQHKKQGQITLEILELLGIKYSILPNDIKSVNLLLEKVVKYMKINNSPYAFVVSKGTFEKYTLKRNIEVNYELSREEAIKIVASHLNLNDIVVSTTGKASRELFEYRENTGDEHEKDFLTVGSMGHASQIALGVALAKPERDVYCFDGDGAFIMHMGGAAIIGNTLPENYKHIILNNGAHDSVGGQPTAGFKLNIQSIAKACGYKTTLLAETKDEVLNNIKVLKTSKGPSLFEIRIKKGARKDLGRPTIEPKQIKQMFMKFLLE